ncbi:protein FAM156A/FAM156B-like [Sciurus carolinensis]|uniref:protein FAM156A/FAM156B-like n=1 Tax=Sciurus carolinensis TaxID=30640 RepID=UPI001FB4B585|nr:protein FAM156A/FAM156B-like [Sciurus carolinensis]
MDEEQQWGSSRLPQKKKKLVERGRQQYTKAGAPYQVERKAKSTSSHDTDQKRFKCECPYCQTCMGNTSGISTGKKATSFSSPWDKLMQDLNNLTLNPGTTQPFLVQGRIQGREEKSQKQVRWKSKRKFQTPLQE